MARLARVVAPGYPHHVTQRGNRRQQTFFCDDDYAAYLELLAEWCSKCGVEVWAYCLMPNHVHLVAVPATADGLRRGIGEAHRRYTRRINFREGWRGHLWQGRFASFVMDEDHLLQAARYVEMNPVRARLAETAAAWPWSSAAAHAAGRDDVLVKAGPMRSRVLEHWADWETYLLDSSAEELPVQMHLHEATGRPMGSRAFVEKLQSHLGRALLPQKRGPKGKGKRKSKRN
ncbi:MAG TPA: transposase [Phycisphaerae bacterium]|nr:transposase [Phycisphaerae bacterium]